MKKILVASATCGKTADREALKEQFREKGLEPVFRSLKESLDDLADYEGILVGTEIVDEAVLNKASRCKAVMKYGVGTDNIDARACKERNIRIGSMPGINSETVAEMAFALMLAVGRKIVQSDAAMKAGKWEREPGTTLVDKTLGIVGTGAIGRKLAEYSAGLRMKVIGYDVYENADFVRIGEYVSLDRLCAEADVISIHVPLNDSTYHLIGKRELQLMKDTAILINTARGGIVDEEALCEALKEGMIAGAALDVYEGEKPQREELLKLPQLITTPHIAAYAADTLRKMDQTAIDKLAAILYDEEAGRQDA